MVFGHTHSRRAWLVLLALATLFAAARPAGRRRGRALVLRMDAHLERRL